MRNELQTVYRWTPHVAVECVMGLLLHIRKVLGSDLDRSQGTVDEGFRCFVYADAAIVTYVNVAHDHFHML